MPSAHHRTTLSGYIITTKALVDNRKKIVKQQYPPTCPRNIVNFHPLAAEIGSGVWSTPANFNGFHVLALLLQRTQPNVARCLAVSWAGTLYIHFRGLLSLTEFCQLQNSLCVEVLRPPILTALLQGTPAAGVSQTLRR